MFYHLCQLAATCVCLSFAAEQLVYTVYTVFSALSLKSGAAAQDDDLRVVRLKLNSEVVVGKTKAQELQTQVIIIYRFVRTSNHVHIVK